MEFEVIGEIFEWRGPAPFFFLALPEDYAREIDEVKHELTYGWGVIRCKILIAESEYPSAIIPKDNTYFVPLKDEIRKRHSLGIGEQVELTFLLGF